jgi:hypothetical protein
MKNHVSDNKLIARTLGIPYKEYHKDWNTLMEAVDYVNSYYVEDEFIYTFVISPTMCKVEGTNGEVENEHGTTSLEVAYITLVKFCEWRTDN